VHELRLIQQFVWVKKGAGKSTTCNILTGLLPLTSGNAVIAGHSILDELSEVRANLGLCPQHDLLFPRLTVWEHLMFYGELNGMVGTELRNYCEDILTRIYLFEVWFYTTTFTNYQSYNLILRRTEIY